MCTKNAIQIIPMYIYIIIFVTIIVKPSFVSNAIRITNDVMYVLTNVATAAILILIGIKIK